MVIIYVNITTEWGIRMKIGDIKVIDNINYLILDILEKNNNIYVMVTKLDKNNEPTMDEYKVYEVTNGDWKQEENPKILNELLPIFTENIRKLVANLTGE